MLTLALTALAGGAAAQPVDAAVAAVTSIGNPYCPHGGNYLSTACLLFTGTYYDTYGEWHSNQMYVDPGLATSTGAHTNHSLWLYSSSPCSAWIELGLTQGFNGQNIYTWYWAYHPLGNGPVFQYKAWPYGENVYPANDGSNHTYWLSYDPATVLFTAAVDSLRVGTPVGLNQGLGYGGCIGQAGLEWSRSTTPPNSWFWSNTFDITPLEYRNTHPGTNTEWKWWPSSDSWIDYPCGQGQNPPQCANGTYLGDGHWSDNKP